MKTILVTGAAGFIGSHLCDLLIAFGNKVIGVDNMSMGSRKNITHLIDHPLFRFYSIDIHDGKYMNENFANYHFDTVFHLAANSDISKSTPEIEMLNTFGTTYALLNLCREHGVKEFVFASSGSVYGEADGWVSEEYGPMHPISHYAAAKLASESFISSYSNIYGIKAWICRLPSVCGSRATHGVIFDFIKKLRDNPDVLEILGDGKQNKPYMHVRDIVDAMVFIWEKADEKINLYNISGTGATDVHSIALFIIAEMKLYPKIVFTGGDRGWPGDVPECRFQTTKLELLGFREKKLSDIAVKTAIKEMLQP